MKAYLRTAMSLVKAAAWSFPTFEKQSAMSGESMEDILNRGFDKETEEALLEHAFERYYKGSSLLGSVESLQPMLDKLELLDINEVACLIDFGVETDCVLEHLPILTNSKTREA